MGSTHFFGGAGQTLSASSNLMAAGYYPAANLAGIDPDLAAGNIRSMVQIFGVTGTLVATNNHLPATGQTLVYQAGDNGTYPSAPGTLSWTDNGDYTYTDNQTGLMWLARPDHWVYGDTPSPWASAITKAITPATWFDPTKALGYTDWRVANIKELFCVFNFASAYSGLMFPTWWYGGTVGSSTTYHADPTQFYDINTAAIVNTLPKTNNMQFMVVRGGQ